jgi:hypothetical protein
MGGYMYGLHATSTGIHPHTFYQELRYRQFCRNFVGIVKWVDMAYTLQVSTRIPFIMNYDTDNFVAILYYSNTGSTIFVLQL